MIDEFRHTDDGVTRLPRVPVDLSARLRELRVQQGLKQSDLARRLRLDPSIPSLWEQGKRPVPASRMEALAEALGVTMDELLDERFADPTTGAPRSEAPERASHGFVAKTTSTGTPALPSYEPLAAAQRAAHDRLDPRLPLVTLVRSTEADRVVVTPEEPPVCAPRVFVPVPRPELIGDVPEGWEVSDRAPDITPSLPDGYWLDVVRLEKTWARDLLRRRLCPSDRAVCERQNVPGAVLAERLYQHCGQQPDFLSPRLPLIELLFRVVLTAPYGGLTVDALLTALRERTGAATLSAPLLRRLKDSVRVYPVTWVDRDRFR